MLYTLYSVPDSASSARCHTKLAVAGSSMVAAAGNASTDTSGLLVWNREMGISLKGIEYMRIYLEIRNKYLFC